MNQRLKAIFSNVRADHEARARLLDLPFPRNRFVVYFTPRSGSSWLTDIVSQSLSMGRCNEIFNPNFMPNIASSCSSSNIHEYIAAIQRRLNSNGAFSFQITFHQLKAIFPDESVFLNNFGGCPSFWLIREDIVEQAVSLAKMVTTSVCHYPGTSNEKIERSDQEFEYDADLIKKWLNHILLAEQGTEEFFSRNEIVPLRMSYEKNFNASSLRVLRMIQGHVEGLEIRNENIIEEHIKIGTIKNRMFAERFKEEERQFLDGVSAERIERLERIGNVPL